MNVGGHNTAAKSDKPCRVGRTIILAILTVAAVFIAALTVEYKLNYPSDIDITYSTVDREPLPEGSVNETGYYTDELNLLIYESELLPGLEKFYRTTGVQPYVYLTDPVYGSQGEPTQTVMKAFAESKYQELFTDDAHLLLVIFKDDGIYSYKHWYWYAVGQNAASVIDTEAWGILTEYLDKYYYDQSLTYEQYFSKVFDLTATRIMSVTTYPLLFIVLLVLFGALIIAGFILIVFRRMKKKQKEEAKRTEEMLNTPLEKFSDSEDKAEMLTRNYDDDPDNDIRL